MTAAKSGFYYPNSIARIYLTSVEEIIGPEAMAAALKLAGLPQLVGSYPPNNLSREFDFTDFAAVCAALEKMYGLRGERGLALHAGKACFDQGLHQFTSVTSFGDLALKSLSTQARLKVGLKTMVGTFTTFSDQICSLTENDRYFIYTIDRCPVCWGRKSEKPICHMALSILQAGLDWFFQGERPPKAEEVSCHAAGDKACVFYIDKNFT